MAGNDFTTEEYVWSGDPEATRSSSRVGMIAVKRPKIACCLCTLLVVLGTFITVRGRHGGDGEDGGMLDAARFVNNTVTVESRNTVNECVSSPCANGGACVDLIDSYGCNCVSGFSGAECQTRQKQHCPADNVCDPFDANCVAGGGSNGHRRALQKQGAGYKCVCHTGYTSTDEGRKCKRTARCTPTTCLNNGVCVEKIGFTECRCGGGYTGLSCKTPPPDGWAGDPVTGLGRTCKSDADCAKYQADYCHHAKARPAKGGHPAQPAKSTCMIVGCAPSKCPSFVVPQPKNNANAPKGASCTNGICEVTRESRIYVYIQIHYIFMISCMYVFVRTVPRITYLSVVCIMHYAWLAAPQTRHAAQISTRAVAW